MGSVEEVTGGRTMKKYDFEYIKDWFVFPLAVSISKRLEFYPPRVAIGIHFLFWHFRYTFSKQEGE